MQSSNTDSMRLKYYTEPKSRELFLWEKLLKQHEKLLKQHEELIKLHRDILEYTEKEHKYTIFLTVASIAVILALISSWAIVTFRNEHLCKNDIKTKIVDKNTLSDIAVYSGKDFSMCTELQCAMTNISYNDLHTRTMPTCDLPSGFDLEVYKPLDVNANDYTMSSQSHAYTQLLENDTCAAKKADSCTCTRMCTCVEKDVHRDVGFTKDPKPGTMCCMGYNVVIHFIIAILLMIALLQIGKYQQHLQNTEVREHNISTDRNLFASAFLHGVKEKHLFTSGIPAISSYYHCANNIASVPFIGEVEILPCDSRGREYWNSDHDITIRIPAGAVPLGVTVQLEVAVALYGPFQFPNNSFPVSPILWLCSQTVITFRKPIEIILPHFINKIKTSGINFAKADHKWYSIDESGNKHYVFDPIGTAFINIKEKTRNYGLLSINHCCYFCITADNSFNSDLALGAGYCFWCIEKPLSPPQSRDKVLLCTTFFLSPCSTALKLQYPASEGYHIHEPIVFQFQKPEDGSEPYISISIQDERCVVAANPPSRVITASQVYFWNHSTENLERMHKERIYPPKITLTMELAKSCPTKPVPIQISVSGAQNDLNKEVLLPLGNTVQHNSPTISVTKWQSTGHRPELKNLLIELRNEVAHEWEDLGIMLDIEPGTLEAIKTTENSTAQSRLREMLKIWQKRINPPPSWSAVVTALEYMKYQGLASDLKIKYNC